MSGTFVRYDLGCVITLRGLLLDAIVGLDAITSSESEAAPAIAGVRQTRLLLETEYLPAVDELSLSDALLRTAFGVELPLGGLAGFLLGDALAFLDLGTTTPTGLEGWTDDEVLEHFRYQMVERDVSTFDADSMAAFEGLYRELERRLTLIGGAAFAEQLGEHVDAVRPAIAGVADQLTNMASQGDTAAAGALATMTNAALILTDRDGDLQAWLKDQAIKGSCGATQILLADSGHATDADLLLAIATTTFARVDNTGSALSMTEGEAATFTNVLNQIGIDPDTAAVLLADETALATMLREGAGLNDDAVEGVFTAGLARPLLQRRGETKSLEQANAELIEGWQVWSRSFDHDAPAFFQRLDPGAGRGLANSLYLYLPSLSSGLISENRTGGERPTEQSVFALVGDEHVEVGTWGEIGVLLGRMTLDDEGAATLRSTADAFTMMQLSTGMKAATTLPGDAGARNSQIGRVAAPAVELNHLLYVGIGLEEDTAQRRHAEAQASRKLIADMIVSTAKKVALKNPLVDVATTPAQEWFDAQLDDWMTSAPPELSRELPLDYPSAFRASFLQTILDADPGTRSLIGLGAVSARRWADIRAATEDYWDAPGADARRLANQRIEQLTNDSDEHGDADEEGRAIAQAYHDVRSSSGLTSWRPLD